MKKILNYLTYIGYVIYYIFALCIGFFAKRTPYYRDLWLISERQTDARDNGYHFFRYLRCEHPEVNCAYIISRESPDYKKTAELGKTIEPQSFRHMIAYACASVYIFTHYISSAPDTYRFAILRRFGFVRGKSVMLQHGIIANDLTELHYPKAKADIFVCSAKAEYEYITERYNYPDGVVKRLGLCRYDRLLSGHDEKKRILVMPTWRYFLRGLSDEDFKKSEYFKNFNSLINDEALGKAMEEKGYEIVLYLHYELQRYAHFFEEKSKRVHVLKMSDADVQQLLMESKLLVTDYSSVFFDFAYMSKPLVYLQFDEDRFFETQYERGYFSCRRDGFGPVMNRVDEAVGFIVDKLNGGVETDEKYKNRVSEFFGEMTGNNCEKTYAEVKKILKH